jgi:hypothetical protein
MTVDEHVAALHAAMRADHEEYIAQVRSWAEQAEANGWTAAARQHREHMARLESMDKPWETSHAA